MEEKDKLYQQLKQAFVAIKKLKADLKEAKEKPKEDIAIIGMGMRFPGGVNSAEDYWDLLKNGVDAIEDIPEDRFNVDELYDAEPNTPGKITVKQGGFIKDIDKFDGSFFDISPVELESVDPQQRLLLEVTYEALENAGLNTKELVDSPTGVFIGVANNDYQKKHFRSGDYTHVNPYSFSGITISANAGRISYLMGLQGPCITMDTACSSSQVATHLAVNSLRNGECNLAIAGGVNIILEPEYTIYFSTLNALSPDSRCKVFSNEADGFIRSEGLGVVVLKRLSDAQRDGDNILAVIKGSAINQDGRSNGFTAPNVSAQIRLLELALQDAGLNAEQIKYIEAHGTGTKIGDPIEVEAISGVHKNAHTKSDPLYLGSVKSNFGHLESAAGMASLIKVVLSLQHGEIPKNLHFNTPNELIDWNNLPFSVPTQSTKWDAENTFAGVSGFGVTGTNGHIILGAAPKVEERARSANFNDLFVLPLSAKTMEALKALAAAYTKFIKESTYPLEDICAMTATSRAHLEKREVFVARTKADLLEQLEDFSKDDLVESAQVFDIDDDVKTVFVFPGQGAQWIGMGLELIKTNEVFRKSIEASSEAILKYADWNLIEELNKGEENNRFKEIDVIQPTLVAIEIALAHWWQSAGVKVDAVIGHSMGEVAAAYIANIISLDDAAKIICKRSQLMKTRSGLGVMGVTELTFDEATEIIKGKENLLSIAVTNSENSTVLSGDETALMDVFKILEEQGKFCRLVKVDVASHSPQMDPIKEELRTSLQSLNPESSAIEFYSTALNKRMNGSDLTADYWVSNLRNPVRFGDAVKSQLKEEVVFIELGPHPVLYTAIEENISTQNATAKVVASFYREKDECLDLYRNLGVFYGSGSKVDWSMVYNKPNFIMLPNYQWQKERFWYDDAPSITVVEGKPLVATGKDNTDFYLVEWEEVELKNSLSELDDVLVIEDEIGVSKVLGTALSNADFTRVDQVEAALMSKDYKRIILFSTLSVGNVAMTTSEEILASQKNGAGLLLQLVQHYNESTAASPEIFIVTNGLQSVLTDEKIVNLAAAPAWGLLRTLVNEHPEIKCTAIDLQATQEEVQIENLINVFKADLSGINELAIRNDQLFTPRLKKSKTSQGKQIVSEGVVLVTGGTSGLGLLYAQWLANNGQKELALVSRSGMKPETQAAIDAMIKVNCNVKVYQADIASLDGVNSLIDSIEQQQGDIKGLVHAAGLLIDSALYNMTNDQLYGVMDAKVMGAWSLHKALEHKALDLFVCFSSAASILGTTGQGNYVAANYFLDQLAHYRKALGLPSTTINWGNIGEVGMAAAQENRGNRLKEQGMDTFMPDDIPTVLSCIHGLDAAQIVAIKLDMDLWAKSNPNVLSNTFYRNLLSEGSIVDQPKESGLFAADTYNGAIKRLKETFKAHVSAITKIPSQRIKEDATFKSMGIDSMMALQLKNKVKADVELNLAVSTIWTYPTIEKYIDFLANELKLKEKYQTEEVKSTSSDVDDMSLDDIMRELGEV